MRLHRLSNQLDNWGQSELQLGHRKWDFDGQTWDLSRISQGNGDDPPRLEKVCGCIYSKKFDMALSNKYQQVVYTTKVCGFTECGT